MQLYYSYEVNDVDCDVYTQCGNSILDTRHFRHWICLQKEMESSGVDMSLEYELTQYDLACMYSSVEMMTKAEPLHKQVLERRER